MSNTSRLKALVHSKTSRALDRFEDPREALDDSYDDQVQMLRQVRRGLADVATAAKRLELQGQELGQRYQRLEGQARQAVEQGRDDLARTALERRGSVKAQVGTLRTQYDALRQQQERLAETEKRLTERVDAFRVEKDTTKATYTASLAQVKVNETVAGISTELNDAAGRLDRAKDKVVQMQARAAATDDLLASGGLRDASGAPDADLERQLRRGGASLEVERQLAAVRKGLPLGQGERDDIPPGTDSWLSFSDGPE